MTSPEALELEAVDAALAGRYVAPEHAELAELALLLRDDRPEPTPAWATHLDRRVEARFPARAKPPRFQWFRTAAPAIVLVALLVIPIGLATTLGGGSDDSGGGGSSGAGAGTAASGGAEEATSAPDAAAPSRGSDEALQHARRSVQRSVTITLAAPRRQIDTVASDIGDITADVGGFVARSSVTSSSGGSLTLRVPSNRLDTTIQRLSKLAKVRELSRDTEDITAQVVSARERGHGQRDREHPRAPADRLARDRRGPQRAAAGEQPRRLRRRRGHARDRARRGGGRRVDAGRRVARRAARARGHRRRAADRGRGGAAAALRLVARLAGAARRDPPAPRARARHGLTASRALWHAAGDDARER
jgi:hypothetical protein